MAQKMYITKYALTDGILELQTNLYSATTCSVIKNGVACYISRKYAHTTMERAIQHANEIRDKKIESLQKQIDELKKITFKK